METQTFEYPLTRAIDAAKALLPHISKDDITPTLMCVKAENETWITSDRYTLARYDMSAHSEALPEQTEINGEHAFITRDAVEWISKINPKNLRENKRRAVTVTDAFYRLQITQLHETLSVSIIHYPETVEKVLTKEIEKLESFDTIKHTSMFPPLERLLETFKPLENTHETVKISLKPSELRKTLDYIAKQDKYAPAVIELSQTDTNKPGPVRIVYERLTTLTQPNLINGKK